MPDQKDRQKPTLQKLEYHPKKGKKSIFFDLFDIPESKIIRFFETQLSGEFSGEIIIQWQHQDHAGDQFYDGKNFIIENIIKNLSDVQLGNYRRKKNNRAQIHIHLDKIVILSIYSAALKFLNSDEFSSADDYWDNAQNQKSMCENIGECIKHELQHAAAKDKLTRIEVDDLTMKLIRWDTILILLSNPLIRSGALREHLEFFFILLVCTTALAFGEGFLNSELRIPYDKRPIEIRARAAEKLPGELVKINREKKEKIKILFEKMLSDLMAFQQQSSLR